MFTNPLASPLASTQMKLKTLPADKVAVLEEGTAITFEEHFAYQTLQSQTFAAGNIDASVAQFLYRVLGEIGSQENGGWAAGTTLAEKIVATQLLGILAEKRIGRVRQ